MKNEHPSSEIKNDSKEPPAPEVLRPQDSNGSSDSKDIASSVVSKPNLKLHRAIYRPSHKATFIGLGVVIFILLINAGIILYLMNSQNSSNSDTSQSEVTINSDVLNTLGVSKTTIGNTGTELVVNPDATFKGDITVGGDVNIAGQLKLNGKLSGLTSLEAGETTLAELNVSGDVTATNLNVRKNLTVVGATTLQGSLTVDQLLTVNNSVNVAGNLAVGGTLTARGFHASTLTSDTTLTTGGHIVTEGTAPGYSRGDTLSSLDTISLSGNDIAGTVAVNVSSGSTAGGGIVAYVSFVNKYSNIPHVIITAVGAGADGVYVNRSASGFSIGVNNKLSVGGHAFDYIVMQ